MRRWIGWLFPCAIAGLLLIMLWKSSTVMEGARAGIALWASSVLPALLPYFIVAELFVESGAAHSMGRYLAGPMRLLFRLPGEGGVAFVLSALAGSPSGARMAGQLSKAGSLKEDEVVRFMSLGALIGPLFMLGSVGGLLGDPRAGWAALSACWLGALCNGLLWRFYGKESKRQTAWRSERKPILAHLPTAIRDGCMAVIAVGGTITLFSVLVNLLKDMNVLQVLSRPIAPLLGQEVAQTILVGMLEMTRGMAEIAGLPLAIEQKTALVAAIASFGGLAIAVQASLFLQGIMPMRLYLLQRSTQAVFGYLGSLLLWPFFFPGTPAFAGASGFCLPCVLIFFLSVMVVLFVFHYILQWRALAKQSKPCIATAAHGKQAPLYYVPQRPNDAPSRQSSAWCADPVDSCERRPDYPVYVSRDRRKDPRRTK